MTLKQRSPLAIHPLLWFMLVLVFVARASAAWKEKVLYSFQSGTGNCTVLGTLMGCGTVFELSPPVTKGGHWKEKVLYSFPTAKQGFVPAGDLVFDSAGNLYGATIYGGGHGTTCNPFYQYCGAVFELSPPLTKGGKWTEKVLHGFRSGTDGANPNGGLVLDSKGAVYGTTFGGGNESGQCGSGGCGTAFELTPPATKGGAWTETLLHRFDRGSSDGGNPSAGLVLDGKHNLYGTTLNGGPGLYGTVFRLAPPSGKSGSWIEAILYGFKNNDEHGADPMSSLTLDSTGHLYGTTNGGGGGFSGGNAFKMNPPIRKGGPWTVNVLHTFTGNPDGNSPAAAPIFDKLGNLYGTTQNGGTGTNCSFQGCGTVFELKP